MSWFDEQLQERLKKDSENFSDALESVAGAVMGKRLSEALSSDVIVESAIGEILKFYHNKQSDEPLPRGVDTVEEQLEYRMRPFGIMHRRVELEHGWYHHAVGAMLGTLREDGSAVALIPGRFSGYSYLDLKTGKRVKLNRKTEALLDTEAVAFYQSLPLKSLTVRDLLRCMAGQLNASDIVLMIGAAAAIALLGLLSPLFTKWLFGSVIESGDTTVLLALAGFMLCFMLSKFLISVYQTLINARINTKLNVAIEAAVMSRVLNLPAVFFKDYSSGELTQRALYIKSLCTTLTQIVGTVGLSSLFSLIYLAQVFAFAPTLVVPSLLITLVTLVLTIVTAILQMQETREIMKSSAHTSGLTYATISGIQKIKLAGAEKRMFSRWGKEYAKEATLQYNPPLFLKLSSTLILAVTLIGTLILYGIAVKSGVNVSDYYAFNTAYAMLSGAFTSFAAIATTISSIQPTLQMIKPILEAEPEISGGKQIVTELRGAIELSSVSFRYSEEMPWVINDLSLKIRPGEYLAIVGSTGCGKSTLMRLLLGFEKPQKGSIYYDRKDITKLDLKSLRRKIGAVMQDGKLFLGDIYSNIIIAAPQLTLDDAWEAAEIASIADDIRQMPMGMNTYIAEGQGGISGGQRQRLMIARAIAPKPKILMFDEATSALDNVTQRKVSEAIDKLSCTRIVIAHRLSTIRHADRIIYLDGGRIVEEGTYDELIEKNGCFAALVARQRIDIDMD